MTHQLTIYGKNVRVVVQTKDLDQKASAEVVQHFSKTISQALLDAPHVGVMREHQHQFIELAADLLEKVDPNEGKGDENPQPTVATPPRKAPAAKKGKSGPFPQGRAHAGGGGR